MADFNQFGSVKPPQSGDAHHCSQCEAMLADALDGTLSAEDQAMFDLHMAGCSSCSTMLADAQRGAAWMQMLQSPRPEPSAALLERIFTQTIGQIGEAANPPIVLGPTDHLRTPNTLLGRPMLVPSAAQASQPIAALTATNVLPFRSRFAIAARVRSLGQAMLQPRLAMTAAMAFFSIALTLNLTGVRLSELRPSDLKPSSIRRGFYEANAHVVRYYDNLRVVYELESRVRDLQHGSDNDGPVNNTPATNPSAKPEDQQDQQQPNNQKSAPKQNRPRPSSGSSRREAPGGSHILSVGYSQRRHIPAVTEALFISQPRFSRNMLEGGLV